MDKKINGSIGSLMQEAIELAVSGTRRVSPNPRTGALVLCNGKVIGRGRHEFFGGPHAEVNAIRNAGKDLAGCSMVVTLEPCCHQGKTPPCTDLIIKSGIKKVYVGMTDPNPIVAGKGIRQLEAAGIEVVSGILASECEVINQPFIKMMQKGFPYITIKSAVTLDGFIADEEGHSKWISSDVSRKSVHAMRAAHDAVLIGMGTALADDPELTVRDAEGEDPLRVVYDPDGMLPFHLKLIDTAKLTSIAVICGPHSTPIWKDRIMQKSVRLIETSYFGAAGLEDGLRQLGKDGVQSVFAEGGGKLQSMLAELDHVDRIELYIAPKMVGKGIRMMKIPSRPMEDALGFIESTWHRSGPDAHFSGVIHRYHTGDVQQDPRRH